MPERDNESGVRFVNEDSAKSRADEDGSDGRQGNTCKSSSLRALKNVPEWTPEQLRNRKLPRVTTGKERMREAVLAGSTTTFAPFGALICAPPISAWLSHQGDDYSGSLLETFPTLIEQYSFWIGLILMLVGLVVAPWLLYRKRISSINSGIEGRFISAISHCLHAIHKYDKSDGEIGDKRELLQKVSLHAQAVMGADSRICVYKWTGEEDDPDPAVVNEFLGFQLEDSNKGDRANASDPRERFDDSTDSGKQFINVIKNNGMSVAVRDVKHPPLHFHTISPNWQNGYKSFYALPIFDSELARGQREVVGALSIDFENKKSFNSRDTQIMEALAKMYSVVYGSATDNPFGPRKEEAKRPNGSTMEFLQGGAA